MAHPPNNLRPAPVHAVVYGEFASQPPLMTQGYPPSQVVSTGHHQPAARPPSSVDSHSVPVTAASVTAAPVTTAPVPQNPAQTRQVLRCTQRSTRAHDPVCGQRTGRSREGGRGRTRGAPNYKPREVEILLNLVEEELPIASKGWKIVGAQFRDWAIVTEHPARTDQSLELKYKQVDSFCKTWYDCLLRPSYSW